jgi:hypothetical protein
MTTPVTVVDGETVVGYDVNRLKTLLASEDANRFFCNRSGECQSPGLRQSYRPSSAPWLASDNISPRSI